MIKLNTTIFLLIASMWIFPTMEYPIDGYATTGIRRLDRLERIQNGELEGTLPVKGSLKTLNEIKLSLDEDKTIKVGTLPEVDPALQKQLNALFPNLHESYSLSILDITPGRPMAYAQRQQDRGFQPGSVGKLAIVTGLMNELQKIYPESFTDRTNLLKTKLVKGGPWAMSDEHTVPFWNPETSKLIKRTVNESDVFSLYEWADHMMSVSNNGAASIVWREALLMRVFDKHYPELTEAEATKYFQITPKSELADIALAVIDEPLACIGISRDEWRLGTFFTRGATSFIPGKGGSHGTTAGLMKWLIAMEKGGIIDHASSLEIKRLMYMTDRRIRYAANKSLDEAAVFFKSGSLYGCQPEEGFECGKYKGNTKNFMNSVAIVEHPDGITYMVVLMSNVLRKNSNSDHNALAGSIDKVIKSRVI